MSFWEGEAPAEPQATITAHREVRPPQKIELHPVQLNVSPEKQVMRVLVRGGYNSDNLFVCCIGFGSVGAIVGILLYFLAAVPEYGLWIASAGAVLLGMAFLRFLSLRSQRLWLEDLEENEFRLSSHRRTVELNDADLVEMTTNVSTHFENGVPKNGKRKTTLLLDAPEFPVELELDYKWPVKNNDPLAELFERWHTAMMTKAEQELQTEGVLVGTNWSLTRDDVSYQPDGKAKADEESVPIRDIAAAEIVDRKVCVWAEGEDLPFLKVPLGTPNATALFVLVNKFIVGKPSSAANTKGLGRVIFERNAGWTKAAIGAGIFFGLILIVGGCLLIFVELQNRPPTIGVYFLASGLIVIGVGLPIGGWLQRTNLLRCHERGLHRNINGKITDLRYEDIRSFTYTAVRHFYNGAYTGTIVTMECISFEGVTTKYTAKFKNADDELDNLRDHVSRVIASTMFKKLEAGQDVPWTNEMTFEPEGIDIRGRAGLFGKTKDQFLEWAEIDNFGMDQGQFALFAYGEKKPVYQTTVATPNFFPGFYCLLMKRFSTPTTPDQAS